MIVQHASNVRTLILLVNQVLNPLFFLASLNKLLVREQYTFELIQSQTADLIESHNFMLQQRTDPDGTGNEQISAFQYLPVDVYRLDSEGFVSMYQ